MFVGIFIIGGGLIFILAGVSLDGVWLPVDAYERGVRSASRRYLHVDVAVEEWFVLLLLLPSESFKAIGHGRGVSALPFVSCWADAFLPVGRLGLWWPCWGRENSVLRRERLEGQFLTHQVIVGL